MVLTEFDEKKYSETMCKEDSLTDTVDCNIDTCTEEDALTDSSSNKRWFSTNPILTEFDEEKYIAMMRREAWEDGYAAGLAEALQERIFNDQMFLFTDMLSDLGQIPNEIVEKAKTLDLNALKTWTLLACKAGSMKEFLDSI